MNLVWKHSQHAGTGRLMLLALADYADDNGNNIYPSIAALAAKCRMSARNVNHVLLALQASGELVVQQNDGPHGTNRYQLRLEPVAPLKDASPLQPPSAPEASFTPEERFTLKPASSTPEAGVLKPLKAASPEPSLNHQEPPERPRKRGERNCPKAFSVTADLEGWAQAQGFRVNLDVETSRFRDYTFKRPITDWPGAWRNWIRNAAEFGAKKAPQHQPATGDATPAWALAAGFKNRFDAENEGCTERNASQFQAGKRLENA
jgi:hypothetical protein